MRSFIKRMIEEHKALNEKCIKLMEHLEKSKVATIPADQLTYFVNDQVLLRTQLTHMTNYLNTLGDRLAFHGITVVLNEDKKGFSYFSDVTNTESKDDK